jgi:2-polyprenyl-3-methyl-5-hydroxy-6-metoxy-1,4-benzoquinol methylase
VNNVAIKKQVLEMYKGSGYGALYSKMRWWMVPFLELEKYLPKEGFILDIGCGYGLMSAVLALTSDERKVTAIDSSDRRIVVAKKSTRSLQNIAFICDDVRNIQMDKCDGIIMIDFLHHIPFLLQEEILALSYENLNPGGVMVIKDVDYEPSVKYLITELFELVFYPKDRFTIRSSIEYSRLLKGVGFDVSVILRPNESIFSTVVYVCNKTPSNHPQATEILI